MLVGSAGNGIFYREEQITCLTGGFDYTQIWKGDFNYNRYRRKDC